MTFIIDGTSGLTFNNATTQNSGGKVIQVVNATYSTLTTTTSASFVSTGLAATITPLFSTSKILVLINDTMQITGAADNGAGLLISRSGTNIWTTSNTGLYSYASTGGTLVSGYMVNVNYLDSPATTSAITYTFQMQSRSSITVSAQYASTPATITLMEISV